MSLFILIECYLIFLLVFPISMEEISSEKRIAPYSKQKTPIEVSKFIQNKEYKDAKKAFEARLWAVVKCTQSYSGVDVFVTSECIHLCILSLVPRCLFQDVSVM